MSLLLGWSPVGSAQPTAAESETPPQAAAPPASAPPAAVPPPEERPPAAEPPTAAPAPATAAPIQPGATETSASEAPTAPPGAAPTSEASAPPPEAATAAAPTTTEPTAAESATSTAAKASRYDSGLEIGRGFHIFDKSYVLLGANTQFFDGVITEAEASYVPSWLISRELFWAGAWASGGLRSENAKLDGRFGGGLQGGFRFLAADAGLVRSGANSELRGRWGIAIAHESFSIDNQRFGRHCPEIGGQETYTEVECERTPVGTALFVYHSMAHGALPGWDGSWSHSFGFSLKIGVGL